MFRSGENDSINNMDFFIIEKSDCIENINQEECDGDKSNGSDDSDDFVIISPHKWNPMMTESILVVPTKNFFNEIVNNTNMEEACHQLDVDFPRQTYTLNNQIINDRNKMMDSFAQLPCTILPVWCSTGCLTYPFENRFLKNCKILAQSFFLTHQIQNLSSQIKPLIVFVELLKI